MTHTLGRSGKRVTNTRPVALVKMNPMFDRVKVGDLIYLGSHPWNTGDVFGHCVIIQKAEHSMLVQAIDVRSACEWVPPRRGMYSVMCQDSRKIIRLA